MSFSGWWPSQIIHTKLSTLVLTLQSSSNWQVLLIDNISSQKCLQQYNNKYTWFWLQYTIFSVELNKQTASRKKLQEILRFLPLFLCLNGFTCKSRESTTASWQLPLWELWYGAVRREHWVESNFCTYCLGSPQRKMYLLQPHSTGLFYTTTSPTILSQEIP